MKGITYLTDERNNLLAVQIDVKKNKKLWEDLKDYLQAISAKHTKKTSIDDLRKELKKAGKL